MPTRLFDIKRRMPMIPWAGMAHNAVSLGFLERSGFSRCWAAALTRRRRGILGGFDAAPAAPDLRRPSCCTCAASRDIQFKKISPLSLQRAIAPAGVRSVSIENDPEPARLLANALLGPIEVGEIWSRLDGCAGDSIYTSLIRPISIMPADNSLGKEQP